MGNVSSPFSSSTAWQQPAIRSDFWFLYVLFMRVWHMGQFGIELAEPNLRSSFWNSGNQHEHVQEPKLLIHKQTQVPSSRPKTLLRHWWIPGVALWVLAEGVLEYVAIVYVCTDTPQLVCGGLTRCLHYMCGPTVSCSKGACILVYKSRIKLIQISERTCRAWGTNPPTTTTRISM